MSQLPSVQLQGPGVFAQPVNPVVYQESQTYFPKPQVSIGFRGLDLGLIGKSIAQLGTQVVETYNEQQVNKTSNALEALQNKTGALIDQWSSVNDFDGVQMTYDEYKEAAKDILGFDPNDEEVGSMLGPYGKLAANARAFSASVDVDIEKKKRGWSDTIAYDNYESYMAREEKYFLEADDKITANANRLLDLEQVFKQQANADIAAELPKTGYSLEQRKLFLKMKKDYTDLLERGAKLTSGKPQIHDIGENTRSMFVLAETLFDAARRNSEQIAKIEQAGPLSPEEQMHVQQLQAEATRYSIDAIRQRRLGMEMLTDHMKRQYIQENYPDMDPNQEPEDLPDAFIDPGSLDAFSMAITSGISAEAGNAMKRAWDSEVQTMNSGISDLLKTTRVLQETAVKKQIDTIDIKISDAEKRLKELDVAIANETDPSKRDILLVSKMSLLDSLEVDIRSNHIIPALPSDLKSKSPALMSFLADQQQARKRRSSIIDSDNLKAALKVSTTGSMGFGLGFDPESRNILEAAIGQKANNVMPVYDHSIKAVNRLRKEYADSPSSSGLSARQTQKKLVDQYIRFQQGQVQYEKLSSADVRTLAMMGASGRISQSGDLGSFGGSLPSLQEALEIVKKNKDNQSFGGNRLPFDTRLFAMTPWYREMMLEADKLGPDAAMQYIQDTTNAFITGPEGMVGKFEDYVPQTGRPDDIPADSETAKMVFEYLLDPTKNNTTTAVSLMILPRETRQSVLAKAREAARTTRDMSVKNQMEIRLDWFDRLNSGYSEQQSAVNHIKAFERSGIDPLLVRVSNEKAQSIGEFKTTEEARNAVSRLTSSSSPEFRTDVEFTLKYFKDILPAVAKKVTIPGWTPDLADNIPARQLLHGSFSDVMMLYLHKAARKESTVPGEPSLEFDFNKPGLIDDAARMFNEHLNNNNYRFSVVDGGFVRTFAERKVTPSGAKKTIISDRDVMAGSTLSVPEKYRSRFVGLSGLFKYDQNSNEISQKMYMGQVADARSITKADYDYLKDDPYHGLIEFGVIKNNYIPRTTLQQFGISEADALFQITRSATAGMPHDNLSALASMAAMSMLDPATTNIDDAKSFVSSTAARIRKDILNGDEKNYALDVVEQPANDGKGSYLPTLVIKSGDRIVSSFQLMSDSYKTDDPSGVVQSLVGTNENDYFSSLYDTTGKPNANLERQAVAYLTKHPDKTIRASLDQSWGYGLSRREVYTTRKRDDGNIDIVLSQEYEDMSGRIVKPTDDFALERQEIIVGTIQKVPEKDRTQLSYPELEQTQDWLNRVVDDAILFNNRPKYPIVETAQQDMVQVEQPVMLSDADSYRRVMASEYDRAVARLETEQRLADIQRDMDLAIETLLGASEQVRAPSMYTTSRGIIGNASATEGTINSLLSKVDERGLKPVKTKENPRFFDLWKSMGRDIPPFFVEQKENSEPDLVPNPKFFDLWKSLWRDYPSLFIEEKK